MTKPCKRSEEEKGNKHPRQRAWPKPRSGAWKPEVVLFARSTGHVERRDTKQGWNVWLRWN